jgi:hypothetical protein
MRKNWGSMPFFNQYRSWYSGVMQGEYIASEESACQYIADGFPWTPKLSDPLGVIQLS